MPNDRSINLAAGNTVPERLSGLRQVLPSLREMAACPEFVELTVGGSLAGNLNVASNPLILPHAGDEARGSLQPAA